MSSPPPHTAPPTPHRYDHVFGPGGTQADLYRQVQDCVPRVLDGYNSTIMAYGQTGSGKTYSMFGTGVGPTGGQLPETAGVIPRAVHDLFAAIKASSSSAPSTIAVYCSFVQIYNEQLFDMLRDGGRDRPLEIHEDGNRDIYVQGLSEFRVKNVEECLVLLRIGEENRAIRETHMNQASSRSHSLFQVVVEQDLSPQDPRWHRLFPGRSQQPDDGASESESAVVLRSKLNLVDLAGSEKWDTRQDIADQHAQELANINSSLFTLGRCIAALCAQNNSPSATTTTNNSTTTTSNALVHVPYRDSKLTRLIQDSLGGNTKTYLFATLSPTAECTEESISTLKFADRAKQVMTFVRQNEEPPPTDYVLVEQLQRENAQLRAMLLRLQAAPRASSLVVTTGPPTDRDREEAARQQDEAQHQALNAAQRRVAELEAGLQQERATTTDLKAELDEAYSRLAAHAQKEEEQARRDQEQAEDELQSSSSSLRPRLHKAEQLTRHFVSLLTKFFAFEIQEGDLRHALLGVVPNVDDYIGGKGASRSVTPPFRLVMPSPQRQPRSEPPPYPRQAPPRGEHPPHHHNHHHHHQYYEPDDGPFLPPHPPSPPRSGFSPLPSSSPHLHAPSPAMTYRVRGTGGARVLHPTADEDPQHRSLVLHPHHLTDREEEEQRLIEQLTRARKRMQRRIKLQEWLIQKEQNELAVMEREEEERRRAEQTRKETDMRFRERAARQKKKLEAYYASLGSSPTPAAAGEGVAATPPPSLSLSPLPSPPRFDPP